MAATIRFFWAYLRRGAEEIWRGAARGTETGRLIRVAHCEESQRADLKVRWHQVAILRFLPARRVGVRENPQIASGFPHSAAADPRWRTPRAACSSSMRSRRARTKSSWFWPRCCSRPAKLCQDRLICSLCALWRRTSRHSLGETPEHQQPSHGRAEDPAPGRQDCHRRNRLRPRDFDAALPSFRRPSQADQNICLRCSTGSEMSKTSCQPLRVWFTTQQSLIGGADERLVA